MRSYNKAILRGHLGRDLNLQHTTGGTAVATTSLAVSRSYRNAEAETVEKTNWIRLKFWGRLAEQAGSVLAKGDFVGIEGEIETDTYERTVGAEVVTMPSFEVKVQRFDLLSSRTESEAADETPEPEVDSPF